MTQNNIRAYQVHMFVKVSGFGRPGIVLPRSIRYEGDSIVFALIRWLSPHPDAGLLRDTTRRPVCPAPFDINHALWTFSKLPHRRTAFTDHLFARQLGLFPGSSNVERRTNATHHERARYDLVTPETFNQYMNCTTIDNDPSKLMETITLPFQDSQTRRQ